MTNYKWILRKGSMKEICPACGKRRFVPYVLASDPSVLAGAKYGRCDREQSCGYILYPSSEKTPYTPNLTPSQPFRPMMETARFPKELAENARILSNNTLLRAFSPILQGLAETMAEYHCGTGENGDCLYFQYDGECVRTGKAIMYGRDGHRLKGDDGNSLPVYWLHKCGRYAEYMKTHEIRQCFFGQHLLTANPDDEVVIVEAEKTAVLLSAYDRQCGVANRIYLACGGSQMLKGAIDLSCLKGRQVTLLPDEGQYWNWRRIAEANGWDIINPKDYAGTEYLILPQGFDAWDVIEHRLKNNNYEIQ